jgi:hypothetical protein
VVLFSDNPHGLVAGPCLAVELAAGEREDGETARAKFVLEVLQLLQIHLCERAPVQHAAPGITSSIPRIARTELGGEQGSVHLDPMLTTSTTLPS